MLPKPLTEDVCSLRADVERLAFSVIWEMTPHADIISTRYTKSVIKSCAAMSYVEAQARMDDRCLLFQLLTLNMLSITPIVLQLKHCHKLGSFSLDFQPFGRSPNCRPAELKLVSKDYEASAL
jgi:exosome complex exonuclease DIS3/RRP44